MCQGALSLSNIPMVCQTTIFTTIMTHPCMLEWQFQELYSHSFIANTLQIDRDLNDTHLIQELTQFILAMTLAGNEISGTFGPMSEEFSIGPNS